MMNERLIGSLHSNILEGETESYDRIYSNILDRFGLLLNDTIYIVDFESGKFLNMISPELFLANFKIDNVMRAGIKHYRRIIHKDDIKKMEMVTSVGLAHLSKLSKDSVLSVRLCCDFRIIDKKGNWILVNHQLTPLEFSLKGDVRLAICRVSLSSASHPVEATISSTDGQVLYRYYPTRKEFLAGEAPRLCPNAIQIIILSGNGLSEKEISAALSIDVNTVKYHKRRIFKLLNVKSMIAAVQWLKNNRAPKKVKSRKKRSRKR